MTFIKLLSGAGIINLEAVEYLAWDAIVPYVQFTNGRLLEITEEDYRALERVIMARGKKK